MARLWSIVTLAWLGATLVQADSLPSNVRSLLRQYWQTKDRGNLSDLTQTDGVAAYIHDRLVEEQTPGRISLSAFRRDLQLGSFAPTGGSTSVVTRPGVTDLISAAIESGAVGRKTDDKAVTFSFNALPIYQIMSGKLPTGCGSQDEDCRNGPGRWIRGLSGSVSVNTSNATTPIPAGTGSTPSPAAFLLGGQKLAALSARYELFVRERDPRALQSAVDAAAKELSSKVATFMEQQAQFEERLGKMLSEARWTEDTQRALQNATSLEAAQDILLSRYRLAYDLVAASQDAQKIRASVFKEKLNYIGEQNKLLAEKLYRKAFTLDYVHQRPSDQPWLHQLRLVFSSPLNPKPADNRIAQARSVAIPTVSLTFNGGVTFYHTIREGAKPGKVRDAQGSMAIDWSPAAWGALRPTYTLAYYFQYMIENGVLQFNQEAVTPGGAAIPLPKPAVELLNTRGPIHVAQFRLSIPIGASGVSFPAAVSYSNRTELITGRPFWQGHIGVSYDFSHLKALLQPAAATNQ